MATAVEIVRGGSADEQAPTGAGVQYQAVFQDQSGMLGGSGHTFILPQDPSDRCGRMTRS